MITAVKALIDVKEAVSMILLQAGFADGSKKIVDNKPMFWFVNVSSKEGGEKETYLTYNIIELAAQTIFGDGEPLSRQVRVKLELFSRNKKIDDILINLNNAFVLNNWPFEFADEIGYDSGNQLYIYSFFTDCVV